MRHRLTLCLAAIGALALLAPPVALANGILIASDGAGGRVAPTQPAPRIRRPGPTAPPVIERPQQLPVTLEGHTVQATIKDGVAHVVVEQVFRNHTARQLEGTYLFPLPKGASISDWEMTMFGKMVRGEIIEREKARTIYENIVSRRRDPGLLEYMGRGLFQARVFPIMPHKDLTIRLGFQMVLPEDGGVAEFRYPLNTDRMNGTAVGNVLVDVKIEGSEDLKAIFSPSHDVEITRDGDRKARVTYERSKRRQTRDLLLYIGRDAHKLGLSVQSHQPVASEGTFMAVLAPRTVVPAEERVSKDIVYVLDTSGSMQDDDKIVSARKALIHGLKLLRPGDRFGIVSFGSAVRPFRDRLVGVEDATIEAATKWVQGLEARGGTNSQGALEQTLAMKPEDDRLFLTVFLTDGKPTIGERSTEALVKQVEQSGKDARVFTFGVGFDLEVKLLDRIAEVSGGARDYLAPGEDIQHVTSRFFRKVDSPVLTDVSLDFGEGIVDVYPKQIPALFAGSQVVIFGRYAKGGDRLIRLKGKVGEQEVTQDYEVTFKEGEGAEYLPRLWAHRKIAYLLDQIRLHGQTEEVVDEIIDLATKHAIVTPYTAGLVVEESELQGRTLREVVDAMPSQRPRTAGGPSTGATRRGRAPAALDGFLRIGGRVPPSSGPGMREPSDPTPMAPTTPAPSAQDRAQDSERLERMKRDANGAETDNDAPSADPVDEAVRAVRERVKSVAGRTFVQGADQRWIQNGYKNGTATTKVEAYSQTYFDLLGKGDKVVRILALGERIVFQHGDVWYEITASE